MSMQIEFESDYNETTYYFGTLKLPERTDNGEYRFTVEVIYFSNLGKWTIDVITWENTPPIRMDKAEKRIKEMVNSWHLNKCSDGTMITAHDPGDENDS